ncbi:MAG: PAS-domain containing protein, partial [Sphingomonadaceae bacterium]
LQLRSIGAAVSFVSGEDAVLPVMIASAVLLGLFAMLFGTRRYEVAGRNEGLLFAISLESIIKFSALLIVALLAMVVFFRAPQVDSAHAAARLADNFHPQFLSIETGVIFLISVMAIIVLPRQFYMGFVEAREPDSFVHARFGLAAYVGGMALLVLPIALGGMAILSGTTPPDVYVLGVPLSAGSQFIAALALLGGVAAAASMAIVDTTALATMVSNDLVLPSLLRGDFALRAGAAGKRVLTIRRLLVVSIMALALLWGSMLGENRSLASIGLIAFAAMAQFTPHFILGVFAPGRDAPAARGSLAAGLVLWLYTLALPPILPEGWLAALANTPLDPLQLFRIGSATPIVHGVFWSLGVNLAIFAIISARTIKAPALPGIVRPGRRVSDQLGLFDLVASFVGREQTQRELGTGKPGEQVDRRSAQRAQEMIAKVIGASPARSLVASALSGGTMSLAEVTRLLDEGGQSLRFSRELLASTFENIDAGISVVDADLNLVAWNSRYLDLFDYPPGMVRVGTPVVDLLRYNARRGDFGDGDIEHHVAKRVEHLRVGLNHSFERRRADGRVIKTVGGPMPKGGYVMSFTDITQEAETRDELERTLDELETRVADRTRELTSANELLAKADREKTRFLAAASHDLLQPLHSARLFSAALRRETMGGSSALVDRIDESIIAAEELLRALLDISKLDAGGIKARPEPIVLGPFLTELVERLTPLATEKGLRLTLGPAPGIVLSDPGLLRSIVQNLVSNAIRYTRNGGIIIGVRKRGQMWRIDVIDSGVGIEKDQQAGIFDEFSRLGTVEVEGLGLGLALSRRLARLLGSEIELVSAPGKGSRFSLTLPAEDAAPMMITPLTDRHDLISPTSGPLNVLVVDNDRRIVDASCLLLGKMGHHPVGAHSIDEALPHAHKIDAVIADYRLDHGDDGVRLIHALRELAPDLPALVITASSDEALETEVRKLGAQWLAKPASPRSIENFLAKVSSLKSFRV